MGRFAYTALAADGQTVTGVIDSPSHAAAIAQLQAGGLLPIEARQATAAPDAGTRTRSRARASTEDIALFARQTGRMLAAGLPLDVALGIVGGLVRKRGSRAVFAAVLARVRDGDGLGRALAAQRGFPDNLVAMVTAAEQAGMLAPVLDRAGTFLDRTAAMRRRVAAAMVYPAILLVVALAAVGLVLTVVLPQFTPLFEEAGARLPLITRAVVAIGDVVARIWWLLPVLALGAVLGWRRAMAWPHLALGAHRMLLRLPLIGPIALMLDAARFARTLGALLANGVPMARAVPLAAQSVGNRCLRRLLLEVEDRLIQGQGLSAPLARAGLFPPVLVQLVRVGEETGHLSDLLIEAADVLDNDSQARIDRLLALLVPVITILMGVAIGTVIAAVFLAMISVNDLAT